MPSLNHIHTYVKYKGRPGFFRCEAPDCTHFIDKEAIRGKLSLCSFCGHQMILDREALRRVKPRCLDCSNTKKALAYRKAHDLARGLGTNEFNPFGLPKQLDLEPEEPDVEELEDEIL